MEDMDMKEKMKDTNSADSRSSRNRTLPKHTLKRRAAVIMAAMAVCVAVIVGLINCAREGRVSAGHIVNVLQAAEEGGGEALDDGELDHVDETLVIEGGEDSETPETSETTETTETTETSYSPEISDTVEVSETSEAARDEAVEAAQEPDTEAYSCMDGQLDTQTVDEDSGNSLETDKSGETDSLVLADRVVTATFYTDKDLTITLSEKEYMPLISVEGKLPEKAAVAAWPQAPSNDQKKIVGEDACKECISYCIMVYTEQDGERVEWQPEEPVKVSFLLPDNALPEGTMSAWLCENDEVDVVPVGKRDEKIVFEVDRF